MIVGIEGKPGSGKSYYATLKIIEDLKNGKKIYTNMENILIRSLAWHIEKTTEGKVRKETVLDNFRILKTKDLRRFWEIPKRQLVNSTIILDEVMLDFFSRDWQKTGKDLIFFFTQHRKYRVDLYYITQSISKVDGVLREMTQYYIRLRNTNHFKMWFVKVPERFVATWFYEDQETIVKREYFKPENNVYRFYDSWSVFQNDVIPSSVSEEPFGPEGRTASGNVIMFPGVAALEKSVVDLPSCWISGCPIHSAGEPCKRKAALLNGALL